MNDSVLEKKSELPLSKLGKVAGKLFSKTEADKLFGPVLEKLPLENVEMNAALAETEKTIMFNINRWTNNYSWG